jgi:uncharacterized membrane protein
VTTRLEYGLPADAIEPRLDRTGAWGMRPAPPNDKEASMASRSRVWPLITGLLLVLTTAPPALAGYIMIDDQDNRTVISLGRIKIVPKQGRTVFALDVGRGRLWLADLEARRAWEGTVDEYCEGMRSTLGTGTTGTQPRRADRTKEFERQLEKLSPEQREQMRQFVEKLTQMSQQAKRRAAAAPTAPREVLVQSTTETAIVAGLLARKYQVFVGGRVYEDIWLTPDLSLASELNVERTADTFGRMVGCLAGARKQSDDVVEASPEYARLYRLGWPLKIVLYEDAQGKPVEGQTRLLVTKMERLDVPESEFTLPADYQRAPLDEVLGTKLPR